MHFSFIGKAQFRQAMLFRNLLFTSELFTLATLYTVTTTCIVKEHQTKEVFVLTLYAYVAKMSVMVAKSFKLYLYLGLQKTDFLPVQTDI